MTMTTFLLTDSVGKLDYLGNLGEK